MIFWYDKFKQYNDRLEAINSGNHCDFYYYDLEFSKFDWTTPPKESLQELYRRRAQQIRDQYDRVVICYSGGIDSTQVLETFYYNNIHIDEILVVGATSQDKEHGSDDNHNGDLYHNVFPYLKDLHLPKTKISFFDYTNYFDKPNTFTLIDKHGDDYVDHIGVRTSLHNLFWYDLDKFLGGNKNTAYVMGKDKPILEFDRLLKKYYMRFHDVSYVDYGNRYQYDNGKRINFYSEPDSVDIIIKQCHMIKDRNEYIQETWQKDIFLNYFENIKPIIYDLKRPLVHQSKKSKTLHLSARDMFLLNHKGSDIYNLYAKAIHGLNKKTDLLKPKVLLSRKWYIT